MRLFSRMKTLFMHVCFRCAKCKQIKHPLYMPRAVLRKKKTGLRRDPFSGCPSGRQARFFAALAATALSSSMMKSERTFM